MNKEQPTVERVVHCNNCGCNIFEHGIKEVLIGGLSETEITFFGGLFPNVDYGTTVIEDPHTSEAYCIECSNVLFLGTVPAWEIVEFYEGHTDYLESYLRFKGGAPVHGW